METFQLPSPIHQLQAAFLEQKGIKVFVKRDDLIHPQISGNKWRKLKFNVEQALKEDKTSLLTFGGAFSNHLIATAFAAKRFGLAAIGVVRGNEFLELNSTLEACESAGMQLHFVSREVYRTKQDQGFISQLKNQFGDFYLIPEGGANELAVKGCEEIVTEIKQKFDYVACAAGTGTTAAGILRSLTDEKLLVFPALKGGEGLEKEILKWQKKEISKSQLQLFTNYHFGGYAKISSELVEFTNQFYKDFCIPLDLVYTSKLFYGLFDLIQSGYFSCGSRILVLHSGGLQGNKGLIARNKIQLDFVKN